MRHTAQEQASSCLRFLESMSEKMDLMMKTEGAMGTRAEYHVDARLRNKDQRKELAREAAGMREQNLSFQAIADELEIGYTTARKLIKEHHNL